VMPITDDQLQALLLKNKIVDEKSFEAAKKYSASFGRALDETLIEKDLVSDEKLGSLLAGFYGLPFVSLSKTSVPEDVFHIIPERVARSQKAIAFARAADGIKIALADPSRSDILVQVAKKTGLKTLGYFATRRDIEATLHSYQKDLQQTLNNLLKEDIGRNPESVLDDPPVAELVDTVIDAASEENSSDIHIEPEETTSLIRFRLDGLLQDVARLPKYLHDRIITRIKVLSNLRTDEHLSAQDGKMRKKMEEENLDIRVSIIPIVEGEKSVMRLLSSRSRQYTLQGLGMNPPDLAKVENAYTKSYGMILSTGPTGSGKTTSIYSILKVLNTREKNITTIEDPVEYRIKGANQVQVNPKTNLTFAAGLRSILRQDPNIIFVGEIRDNETAAIAVNAALTGHLVLSTLHTNDAATAIPRLTDMQVEPFLVASTLSVVIAQRLVRQICPTCRQEAVVEYEQLIRDFPEEIIKKHFKNQKSVPVFRGRGCKLCRLSGYLGRLGLFEVLEVTPQIRKLIFERRDSDIITKAAIEEGMQTILDDGLTKVIAGRTTLEEVRRVTKAEFL
ncbi:MAG: General secretory pathway protein E, partial [Candidatus Amesbacteria bacterium GW2011_GWA1_47_16]